MVRVISEDRHVDKVAVLDADVCALVVPVCHLRDGLDVSFPGLGVVVEDRRVNCAHQGSVAAVHAVLLPLGLASGYAPGDLFRVGEKFSLLDCQCAGVADVFGFAVVPLDESLADGLYRVARVLQDALCDTEGHLRVVRYLSGLQAQPAPTDHLSDLAVVHLDFVRVEEFQRASHGVAYCDAVEGSSDAVLDFVDCILVVYHVQDHYLVSFTLSFR